MTWLDVTSVALVVVAGWAEGKRGFCPAAADLCLVLLALTLAKVVAGAASGLFGSATVAFLVLFVVGVAIAVVASTLFDSYTKWDIGAFDRTIGGAVGVVSGLVLAHAAYHAMALHGAAGQAVVSGSLLAPEIYQLRTLHAIGDMLNHLGGGPRIPDQVRQQQEK
jgi:hypothetical protein